MTTIIEYWASSAEQDEFGQRKAVKVQKIIEEPSVNQQQPIVQYPTGGYVQLNQYQQQPAVIAPAQQQQQQQPQPTASPMQVYQPVWEKPPLQTDHRMTAIACLFGLLALYLLMQTMSLSNETARLEAQNQALKEMAGILRH